MSETARARATRRAASPADIRRVTQPPGVLDRRSGEHWAGRLYMRRLSPYAVWLLLRTPLTPNQVTGLMIVVGVAGGVVLGLGGLWSAVVAAVLLQLYLLLDCADGELARFTDHKSIVGVYLDRVGAYLAEAAVFVGLGFRAQDGLAGGWVELGALGALGLILIKSETDQVDVARSRAGKPAATEDSAELRSARIGALRRVASMLLVHRIIQGIELSLLALLAACYDTVAGGLMATRVLLAACFVVAGVFVVLHLVSVLLSRRLR
ncbi:MAG: CDP-alcohol phosphatidyltransferase family protein [Streptosporangiales bacterium]